MRMRRIVSLVSLILGATRCNPYACTYETRFLGTSGSANEANGVVVADYVNAREYHDDGPVPSYLTWRVTAERLVSPASSLVLRDSQGRTIRSLSLSSTSASSMTAASSFDLSAAEAVAMFDLLASGAASLSLQLQNGAAISVPLRVSSQENWHHPECG